jgi:hypothetical protein
MSIGTTLLTGVPVRVASLHGETADARELCDRIPR